MIINFHRSKSFAQTSLRKKENDKKSCNCFVHDLNFATELISLFFSFVIICGNIISFVISNANINSK